MICTLIVVLSAFPVRMVSLLGRLRSACVIITVVLAGSCLRYTDMALSQSSVLINDCNQNKAAQEKEGTTSNK